MNLDKLHEAQASFLMRYPDGFNDPAMATIRKKHNVNKMVEFSREALSKTNCQRPEALADAMLKIVSRSSMVSRFEKPPFQRFIDGLDSDGKALLARAMYDRLHGKKEQGFERLVDMLGPFKLAKWAIVSAAPFYYAPTREVFVKPNTVKGIIKLLEVEDLCYGSRPTWAFYQGYKKVLESVRKEVEPSLAPNNAALSGFLMMQL
ncbi:MAG: hypothetical protein ACPGQI_02315 [Gammaproteobacteria bacterium]